MTARPAFLLVFSLGLLSACGSDDAPAGPPATPGSGGMGVGGSLRGGSGGASAETGGTSMVAGGSSGLGSGGVGGTTGGSSGLGGALTGGAAGVSGGSGGAAGDSGGNGGAGSGGMLPPSQANYFVAPDGDDENPGTIDAPFRTLAKARDVVRTVNADMSDDIYVYVRGGVHEIQTPVVLGPEDSGTNDHRVQYRAYPGETPVLSGATKVTGWTLHSGNVYKAPLSRSTKLRNLYVNDRRAPMASKTVTPRGGQGTYAVTSGQEPWAWTSGSNADGVRYNATDLPDIASNKEDLEIVNGTTWNENIVCVRDVVTMGSERALMLQQPYGAIAQQPGWNSGFSVSGSHTLVNALEFLTQPGQFYFDKTAGTLYYYPREGEDMASADVQAPIAESLVQIAGASRANRVKNITFAGLTFSNTDYTLHHVGTSCGKATVQGATIFIAYGSGDWHSTQYEITDTLPGMITVNSAESIELVGNVVKHSGNEGISFINDVVGSKIIGNTITDIAGSGITVGHPQHVYAGDGGTRAKFSPEVEGICTANSIENNLIHDTSSLRGFGGHAGVTAFFVDSLSITHNHIEGTAYNGINLGWGWRNFQDSTTAKNNVVNNNRFIDVLTRLHDSGAIYTLGQMPGTTINENYVRGIPPATTGPTYGLHNDEGSAYITENDNVLDIDPNVKYTINCEDFGEKHDLTILRTYATVNKMGINPPSSTIDPPVVVSDNVWPLAQYTTSVNSGVQDAFRSAIPAGLLSVPDHVFPASCEAPADTAELPIRSSGSADHTVWFAPAGTTTFVEGPTMTKAAGNATSIAVPATAGTYKLSVVDSQGQKLGESVAILRIEG
jgi:hypothetical protein